MKCMPLVNMLAMCGKTAPVVVSICDCTSHMVEGGKKMLSLSWSTSVTKWMNLIHQEHLQTVSFLMEQQMSKKRVPYFVPNIHGPCPFMEENMFYLCFLVIWQKSIQFR